MANPMTHTEEALISVIIPAYNAEDTIGAALESVAAQTILIRPEVRGPGSEVGGAGVGIEVIVVDDASTDSTAATAQRWIDDHPSSAFTFHLSSLSSNTGPAGARNAGLAVAHGEWLAFLDADDAWFVERLECQWEWLGKHPDTGLVSAQTRQQVSDPDSTQEASVGYASTVLGLEDFVNGNWVATSTVLVRKAAVIAAGGFDSRFRGPEDYDLWIRMAASERIVRLECPLAHHRPGMDGLSGDDRTFLPEVLRVLDKAFGPGGCLYGFSKSKHVAIARQYWHASWMAFCRGARMQAIVHLLRAIVSGYRPYNRPWHTWICLLARYVVGSPDRRREG